MSRVPRTGLPGCAVLLLGLFARGSHAQQEEAVYLIRPDSDDATAVQLANLTRGELAADRLNVAVVGDPGAAADPRAALRGLAAEPRATVVVLLEIDRQSHGIDLWLRNAATGYEAHRRLENEAAGPDSGRLAPLARHTADAVRALLWEGLLDGLHAGQARAETPPAPPPPSAEIAATPQTSRLALELGVAALGNFDGAGMVFDPVLRMRIDVAKGFQIRAGGAALGSRSGIESPNGGANVGESMGLVEALVAVWPDRPLHPLISGGVGVCDFRVEGVAAYPYVARQADLAGLALDGGLGVSWHASPRFELNAEAHALFAEPIPRVRIADPRTVTLGLPSALAIVTLASRL